MVKQQNLEFFKEFSRNSLKKHFYNVVCIRVLSHINLFSTVRRIFLYFCKRILKFLQIQGLTPSPTPEPPIPRVINYQLVSWRKTREFQEKIKVVRENLWKKHTICLASWGPPPNRRFEGIFNAYFVSKFTQENS